MNVPVRDNVFELAIPDGCLDDDHGKSWSLYLDPERRCVGVYSQIGSGVPMPVWHRRALQICVPARADGESLRKILESQMDLLNAIMDCYLGDEWDGSNRVGRWRQEGEGDRYDPYVHEALVDQLSKELADVTTCWHWLDWISDTEREVTHQTYTELAQGKAPDDIASELAYSDEPDTILDEAEVARWVHERTTELNEVREQARVADGARLTENDAAQPDGTFWIDVELDGEPTEWRVYQLKPGEFVPCGDKLSKWGDPDVLDRFGAVATREIGLALIAGLYIRRRIVELVRGCTEVQS